MGKESNPASPHRSRILILSVILLVLVSSVIAGLVELTFRYIEYKHHVATNRPIFRANPSGAGSYRLKPNVHMAAEVEGTKVEIETNSAGMAWHKVSYHPREDRTRIAFVGDSFTFGSWARNYRQSFVGTLAASLRPDKYEILNFGVGGYGLGDIELLLKEEVVKFQPDIVVLVFFTGNDFRDTYLGLDKYDVVDGTARLRSDILTTQIPRNYWTESLKREHAYKGKGVFGKIKSFLREYSASWRVMSRWKAEWLAQQANRQHPELGDEQLFIEEISLDSSFLSYSFWSQRKYPLVAEKAKDISLKTLERIRRFLTDSGSKLVISSIPYREQVYARKAANELYDINRPQAYVQGYARQNNVAYCDLLPALREYVRQTKKSLYFHKDPHFNDDGHRVVGKLIKNCLLCKNLI